MTGRWLRAVLLAASLAGCSADGPKSCRIARVVDLPLLSGLTLPAVEASLDGQKVAVLIDTGSAVSLIDRDAAERFDLRPGPEDRHVILEGVGGPVLAPLVTVPKLVLGHGIARDLELPVAGSLGGPIEGSPVLGLFGADFLSNYDVDLDRPGRHFAMYRMSRCGSDMQPLAPPAFSIPFNLEDTKVMLDVTLDGKPVHAILDSGSSHTLVSLATARGVGVDPSALAADHLDRIRGIDENALATHVHRFGSLEIGAESMNNFRFGIADVQIGGMIIGDDFLAYNHVWISYPLRRLFIHPVVPSTRAHP